MMKSFGSTTRALILTGGLALVLAALLFALLSTAGSPASAQGGTEAARPAKPTGLSVETQRGSLTASVDWNDVAGATRYLVQWRLSGPGQNLNVGVRVESSATDITVADYGNWVVRVQACNNEAVCGSPASKGFTVEPAPTPTPSNGNDNNPPYFPSTDNIPSWETLENYGPTINIATFGVRDDEGDPITVSLAGDDAGTFAFEFAHMRFGKSFYNLILNATPDYENPADFNNDRVYEVTLQAADTNGTGEFDVTVTVQDVNEIPVITGPAEVDFPERSIADVARYTATDPDGTTPTLTLSGTDEESFHFTNGRLTFVSVPDYEDVANRSYSVTIIASDGTNTATRDVAIRITDVVNERNPLRVSGNIELNIAENSSNLLLETYTVSNAGGQQITWSLGGAHKDFFTLIGGALTLRETPDYETLSSYAVAVDASAGGKNTPRNVTVNVTDVDEAPVITAGPTAVNFAENGTGAVATYTARDPDSNSITWTVDGVDRGKFEISAAGALSFEEPPDFETQGDNDKNNQYQVTVKATANGKSATRDVTVTVTNVLEVGGLVVTATRDSLDVSVDWDDVIEADEYLVRWQRPDAGHYLNQGVRSKSSDATIRVSDYGDWKVQVQACNDSGCGLEVTKSVDVSAGQFCSRTLTVRGVIMDKIPYVADCSSVTAEQLQAITGDLQLGDTIIADLKAGDFDGLTNLTDLYLNNNRLTELPPELFDDLSNLTGLYLNNNQLTALPPGLFDDLSGLRRLRLNNNRLIHEPPHDDPPNNVPVKQLPDDLFNNLTNLETLHLNNNKLEGLPAGMSGNLGSLKELHLDGNSLTAVPANLIDNKPSLHTLRLAHNNISSLPAGLLDGRTNLRTLSLAGNPLTLLPAGALEDLTGIQTLNLGPLLNAGLCQQSQAVKTAILDQLRDISDCKLVTYADVATALDALPFTRVCDRTTAVKNAIVSAVDGVSECADVTKANLKDITTTLALNNKNISSLKMGDLDGLTHVKVVDLQQNSLTTLPLGLFRHLDRATTVKLNNNQLTTLSKITFHDMDALKIVWLNNNNLGTVPAGLFHGHTRLEEIYLHSNNLTSIRNDSFRGLSALKKLRLDENNLSMLGPGIFKDLVLEKLQLDARVDLRVCSLNWDEIFAIMETLEGRVWQCRTITYGDISAYAHQYIEDNFITPHQENHPWLREVWFEVPVPVYIEPGGRGILGLYLVGSGVVLFGSEGYKARRTLYHELTHHYTIHQNTHADDPTAKLSMLSAWLYLTDHKKRFGTPSHVGEGLATMLPQWVMKGRDATFEQEETYAVMDSLSSQKIPQWFFDTYTTDGTLATVDLPELYKSFRYAQGDSYLNIHLRYHLAPLFGGYCSIREGYAALQRADMKNPWVDGGCLNRRPQQVSATAAGSGELNVTWSAPLWSEGPAIDAYMVQWKSGNEDYSTSQRYEEVTDLTSLSHKITGLNPGAEYTVRVAAVNRLGKFDFIDNYGHSRAAETTGTAGSGPGQ